MAIKPQKNKYMDEKFYEYYKNLGASIRKRRKEKGFTQQQLGHKAGNIDRSKISDLENGKEDFQFSTILKLCVALELSPRELFDFDYIM